jgi:hypothetical protein
VAGVDLMLLATAGIAGVAARRLQLRARVGEVVADNDDTTLEQEPERA